MVLKHESKTLGRAVVFLLVMLASPAISKDFGILTRMLYVAFLAEQGVALCIAPHLILRMACVRSGILSAPDFAIQSPRIQAFVIR